MQPKNHRNVKLLLFVGLQCQKHRGKNDKDSELILSVIIRGNKGKTYSTSVHTLSHFQDIKVTS